MLVQTAIVSDKAKLNFFYIKMDTVRQSLLSKKRRADRNGFNSRFTRGRFASHLEYKFFLNPERTSHYCLVLGSNIGFFFSSCWEKDWNIKRSLTCAVKRLFLVLFLYDLLFIFMSGIQNFFKFLFTKSYMLLCFWSSN